MAIRWQRFSLNQKLAGAALLLGALALVAGDPHQGSTATLNAKELSVIVHNEVDHVAPEEMVGWIILGRADFRLIDLRAPGDFAGYHIPGAENVPLPALTEYGLQQNEKIVLYSDGGIHSAQAWFLLRAKGYRGVYMLRGGLEEWKESVLFPQVPADATPEQKALFEKQKAVSAFFGGTPRTGGAAAASTEIALPKLSMPAPGAPAPKAAGAKKKKEGC